MNFVGGEPLLRKDLESLMARAVRRGFEVSFNTNGWLLNERRARAIHEAGVSIVYVSLDGFRSATIDHSRGRPGSLDKALRAIDLLQAHTSPRVVLACILHAGNVEEIPELLSFVRARGLQVVFQPLYQNFGDVEFDPNWWRSSALWPANPQSLQAILDCLDHLSAEVIRGGPICNSVEQLQTMKTYFRQPDQDNRQLCRAGHSDLSFDPKGQIRLCYFLDPVGSIFDPMPLPLRWDSWTALRRRWEVSRCERHCNLLNCNFDPEGGS
jgi:MoaA/NifB/PqqE/SkfB family radical SAM enzyme